MSTTRKIAKNQALGLLPLLTALILDRYFPYTVAFVVGVTLCVIGFILVYVYRRKDVHQYMLIPSMITLTLYSVFLFFDLKPVLYAFSIMIAEILLVVVLSFGVFFKRSLLTKLRNSPLPAYRRASMSMAVNEAFFIGQITQNLYTLHLFIILMYIHFPAAMRSAEVEHFLYHYLGTIIMAGIIVYGQIRTQMMFGGLKKEVWLPVLNDKGRVIGGIARSVSRASKKKYYHPIIRIAIIYNGMLYLRKRSKEEFVSPERLDFPLYRYVRLHQTIDVALHEALGPLAADTTLNPHFMIRYTFENESVKHLVHLYAVTLHDEEQLKHFNDGKLWTPRQIEGEMKTGIFSEYMDKEFPYLQSTVLLAETIRSGGA